MCLKVQIVPKSVGGFVRSDVHHATIVRKSIGKEPVVHSIMGRFLFRQKRWSEASSEFLTALNIFDEVHAVGYSDLDVACRKELQQCLKNARTFEEGSIIRLRPAKVTGLPTPANCVQSSRWQLVNNSFGGRGTMNRNSQICDPGSVCSRRCLATSSIEKDP